MNNLTGINLRSEMLQVFKENLIYDEKESLWNDDTRHFADTVYKGVLSCINDELYLQEFMPYGHVYRATGEYVAKNRENNIEIEDLMEEHISLRDAFWEVRRNVPEKIHNFDAEKRICQCFNSLLQITIQALAGFVQAPFALQHSAKIDHRRGTQTPITGMLGDLRQ